MSGYKYRDDSISICNGIHSRMDIIQKEDWRRKNPELGALDFAKWGVFNLSPLFIQEFCKIFTGKEVSAEDIQSKLEELRDYTEK